MVVEPIPLGLANKKSWLGLDGRKMHSEAEDIDKKWSRWLYFSFSN